MITVPETSTGAQVAGLAAVHSCDSAAGTIAADGGLVAESDAGRLIVARASLVHQMASPTTTITTSTRNTDVFYGMPFACVIRDGGSSNQAVVNIGRDYHKKGK